MKLRTAILCAYLLFALPLFARESTDVIVMRNGDRFTGTIKALYGGVLYVGIPYIIETISVDWSKVGRIESSQLFIVKTEDGSVYNGTISSVETAAGRPIEIRVTEPIEATTEPNRGKTRKTAEASRATTEIPTEPNRGTAAKTVTLNSEKVTGVTQTSEKFFQRFTGGLGGGSIYSKGNESFQYSLSGLIAYPRERWGAQLGVSSNLSANSGTSASTRNQLTFQGFHLLPKENYFAGGFDGFLQSEEQGIARQNTLGGGIGYYIVNNNHAVVSVLGGAAWQNTNYTPTVSAIATQNLTTALIDANAKLFKFDKTNLDLNIILLPALSDPGRIYTAVTTSYYIKITGNLSWNLTFYGNWDNKPPSNLPGSDYGTTSGLSWTFGSSLRTSPTSMQ
jgi:Protein of unknown function, DUF481